MRAGMVSDEQQSETRGKADVASAGQSDVVDKASVRKSLQFRSKARDLLLIPRLAEEMAFDAEPIFIRRPFGPTTLAPELISKSGSLRVVWHYGLRWQSIDRSLGGKRLNRSLRLMDVPARLLIRLISIDLLS
jgi:hypothetical protein